MKAAPDVSRMKAAPDVSRRTAAPVLLVLLLLCVCEVGVGAQDSPPSLSDVMKEVKVLRGMVADQRGDRAVIAAKLTAIPNQLDALQSSDRCACQKQLDTLQSNMSSRLSASEAKMGEVIEAKMGEVIEAKMGEVIEAKMGEVIEKLQKHKDVELVKDNLANLTERYGDLESSNHQLQTQFDQLQSSYQQLNSTCNPVTENAEDRKWRLKRLCETDGFTYDDADGVCYYLSASTEKKTWGESRRFCKTRQADLMIVNSQEKQDLVVHSGAGTHVWIGLTDRDTEGSYTWVDGTTVTSPTFWYPGYPTGKGGHDCVGYANSGGSNRGWYDYPCSTSYRWMCERVVQ